MGMTTKKRLVIFILVLMIILLGLTGVLLYNSEIRTKKHIVPTSTPVQIDLPDTDAIAQRFSRALQFKTISYQDEAKNNWEEYTNFIQYLASAFPLVHAHLTREIVNGYSLLYTWQGSNPSLPPALIIAHYDVVPVEEATESQWKYPPFSGAIADGYIWGRGALDVKCNVLGTLEAVEFLLQQNFQPQRTILIGFGHDEEVGGRNGARKIAELLRERNIQPEFSLDEGMSITKGLIPGVQGLVALVGVAEKGYLSLELATTTAGGHSSNPHRLNSIGILSRAIYRLERNPMPARLAGPIYWMLSDLAPHMDFPMRFVCSNLWLFSPILKHVFANIPSANAGIRTTFAPTIFHAGEKENVIPATAKAVVNIRMLPGDTKYDVINYVIQTIDDPNVEIREFSPEKTDEASPVADIHSIGYQLIVQSIRQIWGDIPIAPSLTLGGTDSINYIGLVKNTFRFQPLIFTEEELSWIHSANERIHIEQYFNAIRFYIQMIKNTASG